MERNKKQKSDSLWEKIKIEYISGIDTMRGLSRKYNVAVSTISKKSAKEGWEQEKSNIAKKAGDSIEQRAVEARASNQDKAMNIVNALMDKMQDAVKCVDKHDVKAMKDIVQSMKDLRDLGVFETEVKDTVITVKFEGGEDLAD